MRFRTIVELGGKTATGIEVPSDIVESLGGGKRPKVVVTIGTYSYRTTVGVMDGRYLVPLAAEHRSAAGVAAGEEIDIEIVADAAPRVVEVPDDLATAVGAVPAAQATFDSLSYSQRKEWVRWVTEAKKPETRQTRVTRTVEALAEGRRTR